MDGTAKWFILPGAEKLEIQKYGLFGNNVNILRHYNLMNGQESS